MRKIEHKKMCCKCRVAAKYVYTSPSILDSDGKPIRVYYCVYHKTPTATRFTT